MMNDTPITDALLDDMGAGWPDRWAEMLKQFERDLIDARAELAEAKAKITRLKGEAQYGVDLFQRAMRAERELAEAVSIWRDKPCYKCGGHNRIMCDMSCQGHEPVVKEYLTATEPALWINEHGDVDHGLDAILDPKGWTPLYTAPPRKEWVGLTQAERHDIRKWPFTREWQKIQEELGPVWSPMMLYLYEAIEAKLKEKNT